MNFSLHDDSIMTWGKHKGQLLKNIPDSYWAWFLDQDWCNEYPQHVEYAKNCDFGDRFSF